MTWLLCYLFHRVDASKSLFRTVPACTDKSCEDTELELNMDRCKCNKHGGAMQVKCNLEIMKFNGMPGATFKDRTTDAQNANRNKREIIYSDDIIYLYDNEKTEHNMYSKRGKRAVQTQMSLENATEYCRKSILDTAAAKVCLEVTGVNATSAIQACAEDLKVSTTLHCNTTKKHLSNTQRRLIKLAFAILVPLGSYSVNVSINWPWSVSQ